jgi:hypothetical protein
MGARSVAPRSIFLLVLLLSVVLFFALLHI